MGIPETNTTNHMKHLHRLRSYLAARRAERLRVDAIREFREANLRARALERRALRLRKLSSGRKFLSGAPGKPERSAKPSKTTPATVPKPRGQRSNLCLPRVQEILQHVTLVQQ